MYKKDLWIYLDYHIYLNKVVQVKMVVTAENSIFVESVPSVHGSRCDCTVSLKQGLLSNIVSIIINIIHIVGIIYRHWAFAVPISPKNFYIRPEDI